MCINKFNPSSGYTGFNYNFGFDGNGTGDGTASNTGFTSPMGFGNWANLGSPTTTDSNDQFSSFLQQTNNGDNGLEPSFSFASFSYGGMFLILIKTFFSMSVLDLGNSETTSDGTFGSFFFGKGESPVNEEQTHVGQSN